ncbi:MAG: tetratricopeptide repeat protein [Acidobacteriia bacterium]|nr:tetratricopeptide repeat protein [Terriglobia bacterium]
MKAILALAAVVFAAVAAATDLDQARTLIEANRLDEARAVLDRAVKDPAQRGESLVLLTRLANVKEDYEAGLGFGKQALQAVPASSDAHYEYAVALRIKMGRASKLKAMMLLGDYKDELAAAIRLDPKNVKPRLEEIGFLLNAPGIAGGDVAKARAKIAELKPLDWRSATKMEAQALRKDGNLEGAVTTLRGLLARVADDYEARISLGLTLQELKRYNEAEEEFSKLLPVTADQWSLAATYQLARTHILGRYEQNKAVEFLLDYIARVPDKAAGLAPRSAAYWRLGNAYEQLAQVAKAREAYEKAIALDAGNDEAKKALKALPKG